MAIICCLGAKDPTDIYAMLRRRHIMFHNINRPDLDLQFFVFMVTDKIPYQEIKEKFASVNPIVFFDDEAVLATFNFEYSADIIANIQNEVLENLYKLAEPQLPKLHTPAWGGYDVVSYPTTISAIGNLKVKVDPGTAPNDKIAELLAELSILYRMTGGSGINFELENVLTHKTDLA